jgi:hypothetical protein
MGDWKSQRQLPFPKVSFQMLNFFRHRAKVRNRQRSFSELTDSKLTIWLSHPCQISLDLLRWVVSAAVRTSWSTLLQTTSFSSRPAFQTRVYTVKDSFKAFFSSLTHLKGLSFLWAIQTRNKKFYLILLQHLLVKFGGLTPPFCNYLTSRIHN